MLTPSAVSTSAAPERDDSARLPCLATGTPAPATMSAAQVEILNEPEASPPVPTTSIASGGAATRSIFARIADDRAGDLVDRLAAHPQRHQQRAHLRGRRVARHHLLERAGSFLARERGSGRDFADECLECIGHDPALSSTGARDFCGPVGAALRRPFEAFQAAAMSRKFFSIRWP